jgi:hypothetical protein
VGFNVFAQTKISGMVTNKTSRFRSQCGFKGSSEGTLNEDVIFT